MTKTEVHEPLGYRVLVSKEKPEETSAGGIVIIDDTRRTEHAAETRATIVAIGNKAWTDNEASRCEVGDKVFIVKYSGMAISSDRYSDVLVNDEDIIARITNE